MPAFVVMNSQDTHGLIRRIQTGDEQAFTALFEQYKNLVYKTAYLILGQAHEADDVLQDVFLHVHRAIDTYDPARGAFSTWLYRITVNDCLSWKRKRRRFWQAISRDEHRDALGFAPELSHEQLTERADEILRAMRSLSAKLRVVVTLRYYCDLSYAEVATVLALPVGTVRSRLNLAMTELRRHLSDDLPATFVAPDTAKAKTEATHALP
jgi:RNA polymerase sigma-70 factor, ECF subfamily